MGILKKGDEPKKEKKHVHFELDKNMIFTLKEAHYPKGQKKASRADTHPPRAPMNLKDMKRVKRFLENHDDQYKGFILVQYAHPEDGTYTLTFADPAVDLAEDPSATRYFNRTFMAETIHEILEKMVKLELDNAPKRPKLNQKAKSLLIFFRTGVW